MIASTIIGNYDRSLGGGGNMASRLAQVRIQVVALGRLQDSGLLAVEVVQRREGEKGCLANLKGFILPIVTIVNLGD